MTKVILLNYDDLSPNLWAHSAVNTYYTNHGYSFTNNFITIPVCSPSRSCTFTGKYGHSCGVTENGGPEGSYKAYLSNNNEAHSVFTELASAGKKSALFGKYMNGYEAGGGGHGSWAYPANHVPTGCTEWGGTGDAYNEFDYTMVIKSTGSASTFQSDPEDPDDYLTDKIKRLALDFITRRASDDFLLFLCPTATHVNPGFDPEDPIGKVHYPAAPRDRIKSGGWPDYWPDPEFPLTGDTGPIALTWPDPAGAQWFNRPPSNAPGWFPPDNLNATALEAYRRQHIQRIQQVQSVDDMINAIMALCVTLGIDDEVHLILTTDNGYHLSEHGLPVGKGTPYWYDVRLPLLYVPPGGLAGPVTIDEPVSNVDFMPTILDIFGITAPADMDGKSLLHLTGDRAAIPWRKTALVTYNTPDFPDWDAAYGTGNAPPFYMVTDDTWMWTTYGERGSAVAPPSERAELYDVPGDPWLLENLGPQVDAASLQALQDFAIAYTTTHGAACWAVGLNPLPAISLGDPVEPQETEAALFVDDYRLSDIAILHASSVLDGTPPMRGENEVIPLRIGTDWNDGKVFHEFKGTMHWVTTSPENTDMIQRLFVRPNILTDLTSVKGDDSRRRQIEVRGADVARFGQGNAHVLMDFTDPAGFWEDSNQITQTVDLPDDMNDVISFTDFRGGLAPIRGWVLTIAGTHMFGPIRYADANTEEWFTLPTDVGNDGTIIVDARTNSVTVVNGAGDSVEWIDKVVKAHAGPLLGGLLPKRADGTIQMKITYDHKNSGQGTATLQARRQYYRGCW